MQISDIPTGWLLLDIERKKKADGKWKISEIALIDCTEEYHNKSVEISVANLTLEKIKNSKVVLGHNIRRHDLAKLFKNIPSWLSLRICDTLELSALFLVGKQTHKLSKLYRQELGFSNPLEDAWESFELYKRLENSGKTLPPLVCYWAWQLLPDGYPRCLISQDENRWRKLEKHWFALQKKFPYADIDALQKYIEAIPKTQNIDNLGVIVFLNWLYHLEKPQAHRPKWIEETFPAFRQAERVTFPFLIQEELSEISLQEELRYFFGDEYTSFRDNQLELVKAFLSQDIVPLGILPTGGGKSLTFQLPALILSRYQRGLSIIISPLQALMIDQVQNLQEYLKKTQVNYVERVALLSATQSLKEQKEIMDGLWQGKIDILYLSPERLRQPTIQRLLQHRPPSLWVLDEAHTLSQWGHDFRPDFLRIAEIIKQMYRGSVHQCRWGFVTATATLKVIDDLKNKVKQLNSGEQNDRLFAGKLEELPKNQEAFQWRKEIITYIQNIPEDDRKERILSILRDEHDQHPNGVAIVYVRFRSETEKYAKFINEIGLKAEAFHGRITSDKKQEILQKFKDKKLDVVVATNAFGMGIDREGIHTVIHFAPPSTPEAYLQEVGRLARKRGEIGKAYLFRDNEDFNRIFVQENKSRISCQALRKCWDVTRERLKQGKGEAWLSTLDLEEHLESNDYDVLATQTRTVFYYLEIGGLIREKESCSCILSIRLLESIKSVANVPIILKNENLVNYFKEIGIKEIGDSIDLDVREASLATAISPPKIIDAIRQLVKADIVSWRYEIAFKFTFPNRQKLEERISQLERSSQAFLESLNQDLPTIEEQNLILINDLESLEKKLSVTSKKSVKLERTLKLLTQLKLARYTKHGRNAIKFYFQGNQDFSHWIKSAGEACDRELKNVKVMESCLDDLFTSKKWDRKDSQLIDIADVDLLLSNSDLSNINSINILNLMQGLGLIILGRGSSNYERLYHLVKGERERWSDSIHKPLSEHYEQKWQRVHAIREILKYENEEKRIEVLRDYFLLSLDDFKQAYFPDTDINSPPIVSDILDNLSPAQTEIVKDDTSRALLVLAGPGSGKTRTIVHRVAHLVAISGVPPARILVLSHTRTAAAEVRKRLYQLLGSRGAQVDALTFHALAIKLTGLKHNDAPSGVINDKKFDWLLEQAIAYIQENGTNYQYILIDEYQDINDLQYQIVKLLGNLQKDADQDQQQDSFLVAVGDPNQNLFEFAGSSNKFINEFRKDWAIQDQPERCLLDNYRSRPVIVDFTNNFISQAIPNNQINQTGQQIRSMRNDERGEILWGEYSHPYDASNWISKEIVDLIADTSMNIKRNDIAVLAHRWKDLRFIQHFLQEKNVPYQFYSNTEDLQPSNSLIGQKILERLRLNPIAKVEHPVDYLEQIRLELGYSDQDVAWKSLLETLKNCKNITQEEMCYLLEEAKTIRPNEVVLSTFHSAKGSEFAHVFVLEDGDNDSYDSCTRKLYVGFTRAKDSLSILFKQGVRQNDPTLVAMSILRNSELNSGVSKIEIPTISLNHQSIRYQLILDPKDLYLSHKSVLITSGRNRIDYYGRNWGGMSIEGKSFYYEYGSANKSGDVAILSEAGKDKLEHFASPRITAKGHTIFRVERDDEWYKRANYSGCEDHHYVVLPCLEIEERIP